jgi:hypothetical protein
MALGWKWKAGESNTVILDKSELVPIVNPLSLKVMNQSHFLTPIL